MMDLPSVDLSAHGKDYTQNARSFIKRWSRNYFISLFEQVFPKHLLRMTLFTCILCLINQQLPLLSYHNFHQRQHGFTLLCTYEIQPQTQHTNTILHENNHLTT